MCIHFIFHTGKNQNAVSIFILFTFTDITDLTRAVMVGGEEDRRASDCKSPRDLKFGKGWGHRKALSHT